MISVKILTYHRPDALLNLLQSLREQRFLDRVIPFDVEVIDNASAFPLSPDVVEKITSVYGASYFYLGADNISTARNAALSRCRSEFLAFIDDDEVASPYWLAHLMRTQEAFGADVVFGAVTPAYVPGSSNWVVTSNILHAPSPETGSEAGFVQSTANCLLKLEALGPTRIRFDERFGRCGGGDSDFFFKLGLLRFKLVWCAEAISVETFNARRATPRWLFRRAFRCGGCDAAIHSRLHPEFYLEKLGWQLASLFKNLRVALASYPKRNEKAHRFASYSWMTFRALGYAFFAITGCVLTEYEGGLKLTKFTHRRPRYFLRPRWRLPRFGLGRT